MQNPTKGDRSGRPKKAPPTPCLYLGCFVFDEPGERDRTGTFQMVVEARSPEDAVDRFSKRLRKLRTTTTLFDDPTTIYINGFIKLSGSFEDGLLVNYEAGDSPPAPHGQIGCLIPEQRDHGADAYGFDPSQKGKKLKEDADTLEPFLDFGGERFREALEKSKGTTIDSSRSSGATPSGFSATPGASASDQREAKKAEARAKKEEAARARAEARAKRARAAALGPTLRELGPRGRDPKATPGATTSGDPGRERAARAPGSSSPRRKPRT